MDKEKLKVPTSRVVIIIAIIFIVVVSIVFLLKNIGTNAENPNNDNMNIKTNITDNVNVIEDNVSKLELEEYKTDNFTMKKPKNWKVETGGIDMYYAIKVYDPEDSRNQVFLMLKIQPLLKSSSAKSFWQNYYALSGSNSQYKLFADAVVLDTPTTECFYQNFNNISKYIKAIDPSFSTINFPTFTNFSKIEEFDSTASMKSVALDSKVLRATFNNESGKNGEGLFLASVVNFGNQYQNGVDTLYYMVYDIMAITSAKDEFINYKDILLESINSIEFTDSFVKNTIDDGNTQTKNALALSASVQSAFNSYMEAWENRNKSFDIMSQKQSDATLGYERVYDIDTGKVYKAYNGFTSDYKGNKYQEITDDMYTTRVSGYIEELGK